MTRSDPKLTEVAPSWPEVTNNYRKWPNITGWSRTERKWPKTDQKRPYDERKWPQMTGNDPQITGGCPNFTGSDPILPGSDPLKTGSDRTKDPKWLPRCPGVNWTPISKRDLQMTGSDPLITGCDQNVNRSDPNVTVWWQIRDKNVIRNSFVGIKNSESIFLKVLIPGLHGSE